mgnify:CR=1 FL=1
MYAVIASGGKQYKVAKGQTLCVEKLEHDLGDTVELDNVLMVVDNEKVTFGKPYVSGAKIVATIEQHGRADKVEILKFKRRKHHMKRMGHRQWFTKLKVTDIKAAG